MFNSRNQFIRSIAGFDGSFCGEMNCTHCCCGRTLEHIERIKEIKKQANVALVLHGGSGVPDDQIKMAIQAGIRKMNFSTDLCYSFLDACRERDKNIVGIDLFMTEPIARVQDFAEAKIIVLGANDRV